MDKVIVVSMDSHAQPMPDVWQEYLEPEFHGYLAAAHEDDAAYTEVMATLAGLRVQSPENVELYDTEGAYRADGHHGLWDLDRRLFEMDREGIAAEFVYAGDARAINLFTDVFGRAYPNEVCDAGVRAYHRWLHDTFGSRPDRLLLVGMSGTALDMDATVAELEWLADHGFAGTYIPGFLAVPGVPPLFDDAWEPVWQLCEARGLPLFVHAGFGVPYGELVHPVRQVKEAMDAADGDRAMAAGRRAAEVFPVDFLSDIRARRPLWQLMLGGVLDRHPGLRIVMTEARADWTPATLRALDEVYLRDRSRFPAAHSPTEYWHANCMTSLSFVHRAEVALRHELGIETCGFGRDYPHNEATWPNTKAWLRDAFDGVPEGEVRLILGENVIRFLGLDRGRLAAIADEIGPSYAELGRDAPPVDPSLIEHFDLRGGYLKPPEGDAKLPEVMALVHEDAAVLLDAASTG
jgi:predicted TIM-barrel fold metal-dependent hydrolase